MIGHTGEPRDEHTAFEELLPWYVTGRLAADEVARVEAHLTACPPCRDQLAAEHALRGAVATAPLGPDAAWIRFKGGLTVARPSRRPPRGVRRAVAAALASPGRLAAFAAAQAAVIALVVAVARLPAPAQATPGYTVLGAAPAPAGNALIVFNPDASERSMRLTLMGVDATIVGGPTPADAYVLHLPATDRAAALAVLRATPHVVLAEAIDAEERP